MLSQWVVDSLLGSLQDGQVGAAGSAGPATSKTKLYDFRRPDKFSKENLSAIRMVHETFSRTLSSSLSSYLRTGVQVQLASVDQIVYDDYVQYLPHPTLISITNLNPLSGRALFEVNLDLAFVMLDRLLGGPGSGMPQTREITDIEYSLFRRLMTQVLACYRTAWSNILPLEPELDEIVQNPTFVQAALPGDMAAFVLCDLKLLDKSGTISICLPHTMLEPVMDRLSAQTWFTSTRRTSAPSSTTHVDVERQLRKVDLDVVVELGQTPLTFLELMALRVGDVVRLNTGIADELVMNVGGRAKYTCRPGQVGRSLGVQITGRLEESEGPSNVSEVK